VAPAYEPAYSQPAVAPAYEPAFTQPAVAPAYEPAYSQPAVAPAYQPAYSQPAVAPAYEPAYNQPAVAPAYEAPTASDAYSASIGALAPVASSSSYGPAEGAALPTYGSAAAIAAPGVPIYIPTKPTPPPPIQRPTQPATEQPVVEYQNEPLPIYYGDLSNYAKKAQQAGTAAASTVVEATSLPEVALAPAAVNDVDPAAADFGLASAGASGYQPKFTAGAASYQPSPAPFTAFRSSNNENFASFSSFRTASPSPLPYYAFPSGVAAAKLDLTPSSSALVPQAEPVAQSLFGGPTAAENDRPLAAGGDDDRFLKEVVDLRTEGNGGVDDTANSLEASSI
jgi:hypothetical protein